MTTKQLREANAQAAFDYRVLDVEDQRFVKEREVCIRETARQTAKGIVDIGQWLAEAKERLPHGRWPAAAKTSFGWSHDTARNFMQVYESFKLRNFRDLEIDVSGITVAEASVIYQNESGAQSA